MNKQILSIGKDALCIIDDFFEKYAPKRIFLVRSKRSYTLCGAEQALTTILEKFSCEITEYSDFQDNPRLEDVERGRQLLEQSRSEFIIACGGGSVIDMAKLIRFANTYEGELTGNDFQKRAELITLLALPTTAGTGCEVTPFAVCYKNMTKYSVAHPDMLPEYAVIYPYFTYNNPPYLTACTGFDALAQSIEAYWNTNATDESDEYAKTAIATLWKNLPIVVNNPTNEIRDIIAEAAYWAGRAIAITKTTAPHAFSYAFTSYCGYPHGHAVALTFPFFMSLNLLEKSPIQVQSRINFEVYNLKMKQFRSLLGLTSQQDVQAVMENYINKLGLSNNGYKGHNLMMLLSKVNIQRLVNNPVIVTDNIMKQLEKALYR